MKKIFNALKAHLAPAAAVIASAAITVSASAVTPAAATMPDSMVNLKSESTKVIYIDGRPESEAQRRADIDSIQKVVSMFYYDQFRHFQDPDAPYFLFMSKDNNLAMGIGGAVRMRAYYDWGGAVPTSSFAPFTIPIPANPASMKRFATTPAGTYLFFRVIGRNKLMGNYQLYIECDFTGYQSRDFRLKRAYATVHDFTFGYAASTFSDPSALPPVVDAAGVNNKFLLRPQYWRVICPVCATVGISVCRLRHPPPQSTYPKGKQLPYRHGCRMPRHWCNMNGQPDSMCASAG